VPDVELVFNNDGWHHFPLCFSFNPECSSSCPSSLHLTDFCPHFRVPFKCLAPCYVFLQLCPFHRLPTCAAAILIFRVYLSNWEISPRRVELGFISFPEPPTMHPPYSNAQSTCVELSRVELSTLHWLGMMWSISSKISIHPQRAETCQLRTIRRVCWGSKGRSSGRTLKFRDGSITGRTPQYI
jgi:hypothetical protein